MFFVNFTATFFAGVFQASLGLLRLELPNPSENKKEKKNED